MATEHWRTPAELFVCEEINVVDHHDNSVALDDHGEVLMIAKDPIWPPMGVNLVFKVSGSSLRSHWMDLCRTSLSHVQTYSHDETPDRHAIAKRRQVTMMEGLTMEEME